MVFETHGNKTGGIEQQPAVVELNGKVIEAVHHFTCERNSLLHLYIDERTSGIDIVVPLKSDKPAYARSARGAEALGIDNGNGKSGGVDVNFVEYEGEQHLLYDVDNDDGTLKIGKVGSRPFTVPVADCNIDDADGDDEEQEKELVTDGGRNIPPCTCGADLLETAELDTSYAPKPGALEPFVAMQEIPDATCGACGESVGAMFGTGVSVAIWEARDAPLPGHDNDDDERELVTDGGREQMRIDDFEGQRPDTYDGPGVQNIAVGDKVIRRINGAKYDPWTVESFDDERAEIRRRGYSQSVNRDWLAEYVPRDDTPAPTYAHTGECKMQGCDNMLENREMPVQGYCGPVHSVRDQYDGDFALDTADVAGFSPEVPR